MKVFSAVALYLLGWLSGAWMLMLVVGIVHIEWIPQLPTIGFGLALLLVGLVSVFALIRAVIGSLIEAIGEAL